MGENIWDHVNDRPGMEKDLKARVYRFLIRHHAAMFEDVADLYEFASEIVEEGLQYMDNAIGIWRTKDANPVDDKPMQDAGQELS